MTPKNQILFALLRCAIFDEKLTEEEQSEYSAELLPQLMRTAELGDVSHLLALGLKKNDLIPKEDTRFDKHIFKAVYRHEKLKCEYESLCTAFEAAHIPFLPLKGAILRDHYPEAWMRTSCDIDVLVRREHLDTAIAYLSDKLGYAEKERATHDISLFSPAGIHVELHFDLVEEGRANNAIDVLSSVWENVSCRHGYGYWYEMTDEFFYFYHVAHMAKHFETGGCGIRPFIDLWILDHLDGANSTVRDALLAKSGLLTFANACRALSQVWLGGRAHDALTAQMQEFLLHGGAYGSADNRVALQQNKKGGRLGYIMSRIFVPYARLKRYYPILEKHRWLTPFMQVRRWFMLIKPDVAKMARKELQTNKSLSRNKADEMQDLLENIGLFDGSL